jgi:hypothetical protein
VLGEHRCGLQPMQHEEGQVPRHETAQLAARTEHARSLAAKRAFPPNFLHESWLDYLYWDVEIEQ